MYLIDTNVVSELWKPRPSPLVTAWLRRAPDQDLFLSGVTIGELQAGVEKLRSRDAARAGEIETWINQLVSAWNILPVDTKAFRYWAVLMHGHSGALIVDTMTAASAHVHGLMVVTRNLRDFTRLGVAALDPFAPV